MPIKVTKSQEDKRIDALQGKGNGGGVGENVGQHNERFNGYTAADGCTINGSSTYDYNHAEGYKNTLTNAQKTHIGGSENSVTNADSALISGKNNVMTNSGSTGFVLAGNGNEIRGQIECSFVGGNSNEIYAGAAYSIVAGNGNRIVGNSPIISSIIACSGGTIVPANLIGGLALGFSTDTSTLPASGASYAIVYGTLGGNTFAVDVAGNVYCRTVTQSNADYAELFEWADGNPDNEDRRGMLVALDGDKIVPADGYDIFGIVSANPAVICNSPQIWQGKFKRDVFGCIIKDENGEPILNPEYDPEKKYIPREQRPEWAAVGLVGKLIIVDNGSCKPNGYVSARNGIGTASLSPTNIRVLRRIDEKHVEVFIK